MESVLEVESCIRGHHVYRSIWTPTIGEQLSCKRELVNEKDPYAVAMIRDRTTVVGHIPRKISAACSLFLVRGGSIDCFVTGERFYSHDLPQGGLEVPCMLRFEGHPKDVLKLKKLVIPQRKSDGGNTDLPMQKPVKKRKIDLNPSITIIEDSINSEDEDGATTSVWLSDPFSHIELTQKDRSAIVMGNWLNDNHINLAQEILKRQFKTLSGLQSTLRLTKLKEPLPGPHSNVVQVLHSRGNHWIVVSTIGCSPGELVIFDSLYSSVDPATLDLLKQLYGVHTKVKLEKCPQQIGGSDCGLFAIANCTTLACGSHPSNVSFNQGRMRQHFLKCLESFNFSPFP